MAVNRWTPPRPAHLHSRAVLGFLWIPDDYWHPLRNGVGYNFWSGIGSDVGELTLATSVVFAIVMAYRRHNCHVQRCWRLQWHVHPDHGHPVCKRHHPERVHNDAGTHESDHWIEVRHHRV